MATNFPTSLDSYTNPTASDRLGDSVGGLTHSGFHAGNNDAIEALEAKVGVNNSAVTTSHDYKLSGVATGDKAASLTGVETLTNKTLTTPTINGGTFTGTIDMSGVTSADVYDNTFKIKDNVDNTKVLQFQVSGVTAGQTRTKTVQDNNGTLYETGGTDVAIVDGGTGASTATEGFDNLAPTTTKGDLIVRDTSDNIRLAVGANNTIPIADSAVAGGIKWGTVGSIASGKIAIDYTQYTTSDGNNSYTVSIPGNSLSTNNGVRFTLAISALQFTGSGSITIAATYGGSSLGSVSLTQSAAVTATGGGMYIGFIFATGATNTQKGQATLTGTIAETGPLLYQRISSATANTAVDSTASQNLVVTITSSGTTSTITTEAIIVEKL